jgi:hypothetical protein
MQNPNIAPVKRHWKINLKKLGFCTQNEAKASSLLFEEEDFVVEDIGCCCCFGLVSSGCCCSCEGNIPVVIVVKLNTKSV